MFKDGMTMRRVAKMQVSPEEMDAMNALDSIWVMTMDTHENVLAYPVDVMIDKVEELWPEKYINESDFRTYEAEDGSQWLMSKRLSIRDIDAFFTLYLHHDEVEVA